MSQLPLLPNENPAPALVKKPVISYYGGKQRLAPKIVPLIPRHTVYVEPFCGGASILFAKPFPSVSNNDHYREVINDMDGRLINFYQQLRDNGEKLVEKIQLTPYSELEYEIAKDLECEDKLEAARRYYVNTQQSFAHKLNGGWRFSVCSENESATWANRLDGLPQYLKRMKKVQVSSKDAISCIDRWDSPQTFFYCDPPYPNTAQGHYSGYSIADFERLIDTLNQCQGSFLVSCYEVPGVVIPDDWEKFEFSATCSASGAGKVGADRSRKATSAELGNRVRTEVVYRRFNRVPVREEIQKLYDSGAYDCFAFPTGDPAPVKQAPSPTTTAPALGPQQLALF